MNYNTNLTPENLEHAVGGTDIIQSTRAEMEAVRSKMKQPLATSDEYRKYESQLESLKSQMDSLTSNNQLDLIGINSRMSNSDNCKKMIGDAAKAHADDMKSKIQFR